MLATPQSEFHDAQGRDCRKKVLIVSANPYAFCVAVEQHLAHMLAPDCQVDALNLYKLASRHSPFFNHWAQRLATRFNRTFERFVTPELSGADITPQVRVSPDRIPPLPRSVDELRAYQIDGAKIGIGVLSSLINLTTISNAKSLDEFGRFLLPSWRAAHLSFQAGQAIKAMGYDAAYIFNGRHCYTRPFCDMLEGTTPVLRYETGGCEDTTTYVMSPQSVHEPAAFAMIINDHEADPAVGAEFFEARLKRASDNPATLFRGLQMDGHIPAGLVRGEYVAFFTSSADERVAALGVEDLGDFRNQNALAFALARICREAGRQLIVRMHPHLRFKNQAWQRGWDFEGLRGEGVLVLEPTDPCDSYELARASHCVVTGGSTVSFECSYLGIPSITVGDALPARMGATAAATNEADLATFIAAPRLVADAREAALAFGSYSMKGGIPLPGYELGKNVRQARLNGRIIDPVRYLSHPIRSLFRR